MSELHYKYLRLYKYELLDDYVIHMPIPIINPCIESTFEIHDYALILYKGFQWDGATGALDTDDFMAASAAHDAIWNAIRLDKLRNTFRVRRWADKVLYKICRKEGMPWFRAMYVYYLVRIFHIVQRGNRVDRGV